ncbi:FMN-dependent alpha-hydroxy acid dehydrogenase [Aureobasidium sp. EXF-12298]|nr:FMN-dependent alpha-hydroxy acid dehydrogenase [Aureobasidium sp. EXF-12298]KAI4759238.1 FMN-dependent alpha-hydroxy acid dehydrogenase [Aureobasidium sp. EXF-12344]KAI4774607.1 FMN-dependent alpha-hydroxy acid dehydrogenase [Aureobasidium sp. EXF-3400]
MRSFAISMALCVATALAVQIDTEGLPDTGLDTSSWTTGTLPPIEDLVDANDFQIAAKNVLSDRHYAYYRTAALDEITYNANMRDWNKIRLNGFSFTDVSNINTKTSILGYEFDAPFFIAPAAKAGYASSGAESNLVKAAGAANLLYVPSISSSQSIEEIGAAAASGQVMFHQEYIWSDTAKLQDELNRMKKAGFKAIFLTVDNTGVNGIRDRYLRFSSGGDAGHSSTFTIDSLNKLRNMTTLPIVPKGVKTAHDVKLCADLGFPAVYISNHGGRVVDMAPTAVEVLLDVHRLYPEVFDKIEIYADGGIIDTLLNTPRHNFFSLVRDSTQTTSDPFRTSPPVDPFISDFQGREQIRNFVATHLDDPPSGDLEACQYALLDERSVMDHTVILAHSYSSFQMRDRDTMTEDELSHWDGECEERIDEPDDSWREWRVRFEEAETLSTYLCFECDFTVKLYNDDFVAAHTDDKGIFQLDSAHRAFEDTAA